MQTNQISDVLPSDRKLTNEFFDQNQILCTGEILRLWPKGADTMARFRIAGPDLKQPGQFCEHVVTLLMPGGKINGRLATLAKGDRLSIRGYLGAFTYRETLKKFLDKSGQREYFRGVKLEKQLMEISALRYGTAIIPLEIEYLQANSLPCNTFSGSGIIVRRPWSRYGNLQARLASYDCHTAIDENAQAAGEERPRRVPHYWNILIPSGQLAGRKITLKEKQSARLEGAMGTLFFLENLREFFLRAKKADMIEQIDRDVSLIEEVKIYRSHVCVVASSLTQYTRK